MILVFVGIAIAIVLLLSLSLVLVLALLLKTASRDEVVATESYYFSEASGTTPPRVREDPLGNPPSPEQVFTPGKSRVASFLPLDFV